MQIAIGAQSKTIRWPS
ncbi:hypothetical protein GQ607_000465 [Colletotrichum asianum]|uniref:Uncharacterized protein n=1 Tax=Colletotrichum asianum TaxID=702518 RepID=A0A8H3WSP5_9PEZI|nr:hypothetical protein GQ607_000465 [Colletotrichum asianum]